jgi:RNA recognition motif-containing protein
VLIGNTDNAVTERTVYYCQVTFGEGATVQRIVTPFESCLLILSQLPPNLTQMDLITLVEPFGDLTRAVIIDEPNHVAVTNTLKKARIEYAEYSHAARAVDQLNDKPFQSSVLAARLDIRAVESGSGVLVSRKVKISWFAPTVVAWAHYPTIARAREHAARLDGKAFDGRKISVSFQVPGPRQTKSFSIEIKGLPLTTSSKSLEKFCKSQSVRIAEASYDRQSSIQDVRNALGERQGDIECFDVLPADNSKTKIVAFAQFCSSDSATTAVKRFHGVKQHFLRNNPLWLEQVHALKYSIPLHQFEIIRSDLDHLQITHESECRLRYYDRDEHGRSASFVTIRLYGADAKGLGRAKVQLERLLQGELLVLHGEGVWDECFETAESQTNLNAEPDVYIKVDNRTRTIRLFGDDVSREKARQLVLRHIEDAGTCRHYLKVKKEALRALLTGGRLKELHDKIGPEKVVLDIVSRTLTVKGNDEDVTLVRRIVGSIDKESPAELELPHTEELCPVCLCDIIVPTKLPCGHTYCESCLRHLVMSATGPNFSVLRCVAEVTGKPDSTSPCGINIAYSVIRELLSSTQETDLLQSSFLSYTHTHSENYRYCPTPDCKVVYRPGKTGSTTVFRCPSCLARICATCHVEFHEGLTCEEHRDDGIQALQQWKDEHGIKSCPKCSTPIEKNGGCNHMECFMCHSHICWVCMKLFPPGDVIYVHMMKTHGSSI